MTTYVYSGEFRGLTKAKSFYIDKIYTQYFTQDTTKNGKFYQNIYKLFPQIPDETILSNDTRLTDTVGTELRLQEWNDNLRMFQFHKIPQRRGDEYKEFMKSLKKVFDIKVITSTPIDLIDKKKNKVSISDIVFSAVGAYKIKVALKDLDLDEDVEEVDVKRKGKEGEMVTEKMKVFNYEDAIKNRLEGKFLKLKVSGEGMKTEYKFRKGDEFSTGKEELPPDPFDNIEDIPF